MSLAADLKQRKVVQWGIAYAAAAFALLQGVDIIAQQFGWPEGLQRGIALAMVLGFFVLVTNPRRRDRPESSRGRARLTAVTNMRGSR